MKPPLVSFYIITFNQSQFIEEAIIAAFKQDYSPIEIIISDDCSTDDTWKKIQLIVAAYQGSHQVFIRRNAVNLGISNHINAIWKECKGDWIVASAGDDFSHPQRVSKIMSVVSQFPNAKLVQSWLEEIDERGNFISLNKLNDDNAQTDEPLRKMTIHDRCSGQTLNYHGAAMAYSKAVVSNFPELPSRIIFEDNIVNFRAELLGDVFYIRSPLVSHRNHSGQITNNNAITSYSILENRELKRLTSDVYSFIQNIDDLSLAQRKQLVDDKIFGRLSDDLLLKLHNAKDYRNALIGIWPVTIFYFLKSFINGNRWSDKNSVIRALFPKWIYRYFFYYLRRLLFEISRRNLRIQ